MKIKGIRNVMMIKDGGTIIFEFNDRLFMQDNSISAKMKGQAGLIYYARKCRYSHKKAGSVSPELYGVLIRNLKQYKNERNNPMATVPKLSYTELRMLIKALDSDTDRLLENADNEGWSLEEEKIKEETGDQVIDFSEHNDRLEAAGDRAVDAKREEITKLITKLEKRAKQHDEENE